MSGSDQRQKAPASMFMPTTLRIVIFLIVGAMPSTFVLAQDAPNFPGGASSLQEVFQDWRVACQVIEATRRCALFQQQARQDGQRVLAIELQPGPDNTATGNLVLPFGLLLDAGITLQIDEQPAMDPLRFQTCIPAGCVVDISFDAETVAALRGGAALKITAKTADTQQDFPVTVPLNGLSAGLDRIRTLIEY